MPPLPGFKVDAVAQLARELRFVPRERLILDIRRTEDLSLELDPDTLYPQDWLTFRVTGYRPAIDAPALIVGSALRRDLAALVEHLCHAARLHENDHAPGELLSADDVAQQLAISRKTLDRRRREGLISRRVFGPDGHERIMFRASLIHALGSAPKPPRVSRRFHDTESRAMLRRARRYAALGLSLNAAALRIARRFSRSHEGVRQLLQREDRQRTRENQPTIFEPTAPLTTARRAAFLRALRMGMKLSSLAASANLTPPSLRRSLVLARAEQLSRWRSRGVLDGPRADTTPTKAELATLALDDVCGGLVFRAPATLLELISDARLHPPINPRIESARLRALHTLRRRAAVAIDRLHSHHPSAIAIDAIETDLRWIARLKATLLAPDLRVILDTIETRIARGLYALAPARLASLLLASIRRCANALDATDPARAGRVAAIVALQADRLVADWARAHEREISTRAEHILPPGFPIADWSRLVSPWSIALFPSPRVLARLDQLDPDQRRFLERRFALDGRAPDTLVILAKAFDRTPIRAAMFEQASLEHAWTRTWADR